MINHDSKLFSLLDINKILHWTILTQVIYQFIFKYPCGRPIVNSLSETLVTFILWMRGGVISKITSCVRAVTTQSALQTIFCWQFSYFLAALHPSLSLRLSSSTTSCSPSPPPGPGWSSPPDPPPRCTAPGWTRPRRGIAPPSLAVRQGPPT